MYFLQKNIAKYPRECTFSQQEKARNSFRAKDFDHTSNKTAFIFFIFQNIFLAKPILAICILLIYNYIDVEKPRITAVKGTTIGAKPLDCRPLREGQSGARLGSIHGHDSGTLPFTEKEGSSAIPTRKPICAPGSPLQASATRCLKTSSVSYDFFLRPLGRSF